jgi:hypothetical protein
VRKQKELQVFFALSMASFVLTMIPKVISFYIILKILCGCEKKYNNNPVHGQSKLSSYDEDKRRKLIFRSFTFSEFRSQAVCVDYIWYEKHKTEFLMSAFKFSAEDLPNFIVQVIYLIATDCGVNNSNTLVYMSVFASVLSSYCGFMFRLSIYMYCSRRLYAY